MDADMSRWKSDDQSRIKVQALELCGDFSGAQEERLRRFAISLEPSLYEEIFAAEKEEVRHTFKQQAIKTAFAYAQPLQALSFFMHIGALEQAAQLVRDKIEQLSGQSYYLLRPAAELLASIDPLSATLLYRALITPVMEAAKSKYYPYAAKDLVACTFLAGEVIDWAGFTEHSLYFETFRAAHKKKTSFWPEYEAQMQKKQAKQLKQQKTQTPLS
jgi:hypothetical protein